MKRSFILFGKPSFGDEEIQAVTEVLRSGWIGMGPKTLEFEKAFANYVGAEHAVAVSSCTAALHLSLLAVGVRPGSEVITTPLTFVATINAIRQTGARAVLVDIDPATFNLDPEKIEKFVSSKTHAIIPVHFGGLSCNMDALASIVERHPTIKLIEDAAHAVGTRHADGKRVGGNNETLTCFSFYPNKNMTSVEGGMITTGLFEIAEKLKVMRMHGLNNEAWSRFSAGTKLMNQDAVMPGFKYNMTDVQAAIGLCQLRKLEEFQRVRESYAEMYDAYFKGLPCRKQPRTPGRHALHLYVLVLDPESLNISRNELVQEIREHQIGAGVHYDAIHLLSYPGKMLGYRRGDFPNAEYVSDNIFTLPLTPSMNAADVRYVGETVRSIIQSHQTV
jgi:dTDP-4-amino-4,6-dideoxygalactose transaminase